MRTVLIVPLLAMSLSGAPKPQNLDKGLEALVRFSEFRNPAGVEVTQKQEDVLDYSIHELRLGVAEDSIKARLFLGSSLYLKAAVNDGQGEEYRPILSESIETLLSSIGKVKADQEHLPNLEMAQHRYSLARAYLMQGNSEAAVDELRHALGLGHGSTDKRLVDLYQFLTIDGKFGHNDNSPFTKYEEGLTMVTQGDYQGAKTIGDGLIQDTTTKDDGYRLLANSRFQQGLSEFKQHNFTAAKESFLEALDYYSHVEYQDVGTIAGRASIYRSMGFVDRTGELLRGALIKNQDDPEYLFQVGQNLFHYAQDIENAGFDKSAASLRVDGKQFMDRVLQLQPNVDRYMP